MAIPSAVQVFAWIATIAAGRLKLTAASLFVLGFLVTFVMGGLTGVMVAVLDERFRVTAERLGLDLDKIRATEARLVHARWVEADRAALAAMQEAKTAE